MEDDRSGDRAASAVVRPAARVILIDEDDRVFLFHGRDVERQRTFWIMPGGGLEPGEDAAAGARRELREETGLVLGADLRPPVWTRVHTYPWVGGLIEQHETYFVAHVQRDEMTVPPGDDYTFEHRWWSLDEIRRTAELLVPRRMAEFLPAVLSGEIPPFPIDVGS